MTISVDDLAQEIRRVDGRHDLGAGALAEALLPFIAARLREPAGVGATAAKDAEIEALRAEVERWKREHLAELTEVGEQSEARSHAEARAERLEEAVNAVLADMSEWGEPAKGAHILRVINFLSMALHPTAAQEGKSDE